LREREKVKKMQHEANRKEEKGGHLNRGSTKKITRPAFLKTRGKKRKRG